MNNNKALDVLTELFDSKIKSGPKTKLCLEYLDRWGYRLASNKGCGIAGSQLAKATGSSLGYSYKLLKKLVEAEIIEMYMPAMFGNAAIYHWHRSQVELIDLYKTESKMFFELREKEEDLSVWPTFPF